MKNYIYIAFVVLYSCSSSIPDEYVQKIDRLTAELKKTKAIASLAVSKVNELEEKLNIALKNVIVLYMIISKRQHYYELQIHFTKAIMLYLRNNIKKLLSII